MERLKYLTVAEAQRMKDAATSNRDRAMIGILLHTGMRIGELGGLQVRDFDPEARTIRIERTLINSWSIINPKTGELKKYLGRDIYKATRPISILLENGTTKLVFPKGLGKVVGIDRDFVKLGTKRHAQGRIVPLSDEGQDWVAVEAERYGRDPHSWMWRPGLQGAWSKKQQERTANGGAARLTYASVRDVVIRTMERAQIPIEKRHPHTTRHTFAVQWLTNGGDLRSLQRIGGWASIQSVAIYLDLVSADLTKIADRVKLGY